MTPDRRKPRDKWTALKRFLDRERRKPITGQRMAALLDVEREMMRLESKR